MHRISTEGKEILSKFKNGILNEYEIESIYYFTMSF